jgi:hypothetical protein
MVAKIIVILKNWEKGSFTTEFVKSDVIFSSWLIKEKATATRPKINTIPTLPDFDLSRNRS